MFPFQKKSSFYKYFTNTSWLLGERIIRMGVTLFVGIYVARYLGPESYGILSYSLSFAWLFSALLDLANREIIVRELVNNPDKHKLILSSAITLRLAGALLLGCVVSVCLQFVDNDRVTLIMIALITIGIMFQSWELIDYYFQSQVQSKYTVWAQISQLFLASLSKLTLIICEASLVWFAFVFLIEYVFLAFLYFLIFIWKVGKFSIKFFDYKFSKQLLKNSLPMLLTGLSIMIYMKIDQIMLKELVDIKSVGIYSAAVKLCEAWYPIPVLLAGSLYPAIINAKKTNKEVYHSHVQKLYSLLVWLAITLAIPITLFSDLIIGYLYGNEFSKSVIILQIYIWASIFVFMSVASHKWLVIEKLEKYIFITTFLGMVINIVGNIVLIPIYGAYGAAIATIISYGISSYGSLLLLPKLRLGFWFATKSFNPFLHFLFTKKGNEN